MKLECKAYKGMCKLAFFTINGIEADEADFGSHYDRMPKTGNSCACKDMKFIPKNPTVKVLEKYTLSINEYEQVCDKLDKELSFGACCFCDLQQSYKQEWKSKIVETTYTASVYLGVRKKDFKQFLSQLQNLQGFRNEIKEKVLNIFYVDAYEQKEKKNSLIFTWHKYPWNVWNSVAIQYIMENLIFCYNVSFAKIADKYRDSENFCDIMLNNGNPDVTFLLNIKEDDYGVL